MNTKYRYIHLVRGEYVLSESFEVEDEAAKGMVDKVSGFLFPERSAYSWAVYKTGCNCERCVAGRLLRNERRYEKRI